MPTNASRGTYRDERDAEKKRVELERRRKDEQARLDAHNRRIREQAATQAASKPGRIISKPRILPAPFDPERGRYRMARMLPGPVRPPSTCMPRGAGEAFGPRLECPHCGAPMLGYVGRGRYYCSTVRLAVKGIGCGRYTYGPCNPGEMPYTEAERAEFDADDSLPIYPR